MQNCLFYRSRYRFHFSAFDFYSSIHYTIGTHSMNYSASLTKMNLRPTRNDTLYFLLLHIYIGNASWIFCGLDLKWPVALCPVLLSAAESLHSVCLIPQLKRLSICLFDTGISISIVNQKKKNSKYFFLNVSFQYNWGCFSEIRIKV